MIPTQNIPKELAFPAQNLRCLSIIMPVYNEVFTLPQILHKIHSVPVPKEIIIIDDLSTDGTREFIKSLEDKNHAPISSHAHPTKIKILLHERNQGKGACIRTGVAHAEGDIAIIQDADLEYDPADYFKVIAPILSGEADVVYGSRFRGERRRVLYFWHAAGNYFLTLISNMCTDLNLSDMETCYKAFKTEILKSIPIRARGFEFEPEITAKVAKLGCSIYEVPISYQGRSYSEGKKITWKDGCIALYYILKYWLIDDLFEGTAGLRTLRIMEGSGKYNEWLFNQCKPFLGKRVLETGSGPGNITKYLLAKPFILATDIDPYYIENLKRKFNPFPQIQVEALDLSDLETLQMLVQKFQVDCCLSMNVLEHIDSDQTVLSNIYEALPPGGNLVLLVPAHPFLYSDMDKYLGHFRRYNKNNLREILEKVGFKVETLRYLNMLGAVGWFVNGKIFRKKLIPSQQMRIFNSLTKALVLEKSFNPPFGLSILAVGKK